ncbi:MAG: aminotransferase class IV, partial [Actinomycetota bacterium]
GYVAEGSGENLFLIRNGVVTTPPVSAGVLEGLTREAMITLLRDDGYEVIEGDVIRTDLYYADEMFFTGTAAEVTPIREVDDRTVGDGKPGPVTKRAQELFMDLVTGENERHSDWLDYV